MLQLMMDEVITTIEEGRTSGFYNNDDHDFRYRFDRHLYSVGHLSYKQTLWDSFIDLKDLDKSMVLCKHCQDDSSHNQAQLLVSSPTLRYRNQGCVKLKQPARFHLVVVLGFILTSLHEHLGGEAFLLTNRANQNALGKTHADAADGDGRYMLPYQCKQFIHFIFALLQIQLLPCKNSLRDLDTL
ncbi:PPR repeat [Musa troglodytarum]|uniref:PPR repeat n=1 Tax=Musa troglodytarum TaxID=320322 RepID=A0A9E7EI32_9LILI|nr:PPR repeat [Musa troglodytarum]